MLFQDVISLSIVPLICFMFVMFVITRNMRYLYIFLAAIAVAISVQIIKKLIGSITTNELFYRPNDKKVPAFPSGHMAVATFMAIVLMDYDYDHVGGFLPVFLLLYVVLMAYSRYVKRCHNIPQILGGIVYGTVCAWAFKKVLKI